MRENDRGPTKSESQSLIEANVSRADDVGLSDSSVFALKNGKPQPVYPARRFNILSLDGGGIRGLFSLGVLADIEKQLGIRVVDHFDLIAGTSTGGIIALSLGAGKSPLEILKLYLTIGESVFPARFFRRKALAFRRIFMNKFDFGILRSHLQHANVLGERTLKDSMKRLLIPCYNLSQNTVRVFRTPYYPGSSNAGDGECKAWQVALAASAAPTYFPACHHLDEQVLIDGGIWANNPSLLAVVEGIKNFRQNIDDIHVFNIGTCTAVERYKQSLSRGGILKWAPKAISVALRGQSIGADTMVRDLLGPQKAVRIDVQVPAGLFQMDKFESAILGEAKAVRDISCSHFDDFKSHLAPTYCGQGI